MSVQEIKSMPENIEAEQSILSIMFRDNEKIPKIIEKLNSKDFYKEGHQIIFSAALDMYHKDLPFKVDFLTDYLSTKGELANCGGVTYITKLATYESTSAFLEHYMASVLEKSLLRKLINTGEAIQKDAYTRQDEAFDVLEQAEKSIFDIASKRESKDFVPLYEAIDAGLERLEEIYKNKGKLTGLETPFKELDKMTAGLQKGDMILIAARPSMGKSTFAMNIVEHAALKDNKTCAVFSLEMSTDSLANKMLCSAANVEMNKLRTGELDDRDWDNLSRASAPLSKAKIFIDDTAGITITEIRSKCRRLKQDAGLDLVMIDYLQLMNGRGDNRQQQISEISRSIKLLAKEMECPVIALSQLSRAPEQRDDHRPLLSDLRESGSIEQDADLVMFLYRDEYYNRDDESLKGKAECIIAKQRNGSVGTVHLTFIGKYSKFAPASDLKEEEY